MQCYFMFSMIVFNINLLMLKIRQFLHHGWPDFSFLFPTQPPKKTVIFVSMRYKELTAHHQRTRESTVLSMVVMFFTTTNAYLMWRILATIPRTHSTTCVNWKCMVSNEGLLGTMKSIYFLFLIDRQTCVEVDGFV